MRRPFACAAAGALALIAASTVRAQTVDEIIAKNIEAKGGLEKLKSTNSVRISGRAIVQGMSVPVLIVSKRPNLMRNEMDMAGQKVIQGFDGATMWASVPGMPPQEIPPGPQTEMLKRNSQFDPIFLDYKEKGHRIEYKGKEADGGKQAHHLVVTPKEGPVVHYYIDVVSGLETKTVTEIQVPAMKAQFETRMSDYRNVDGRMFPFTLVHVVDGNMMETRFERVEFNVQLDDALFKIPK